MKASCHVARHDGIVRLIDCGFGGLLVLSRTTGSLLEKYEVPCGSNLLVDDKDEVHAGQILVEWEPTADQEDVED